MKKLIKMFVGEHLEIKYRLLNFMLIVCFLGGAIGTVVSLIEGIELPGLLAAYSLELLAVIGIYMSIVKNKPKTAAVLTATLGNFLFFPLMYISSGGIMSGMPLWFVMGLLFIYLVLEGVVFYVVLTISCLIIVGLVLLDYYMPGLTNPLTGSAFFFDVVFAVLMVSLIFGIIFKYQAYTYEKNRKEILHKDKELSEMNAKLIQAGNAKDEFLARMSHEIRTPINAIMGMDEMIVRECDDQLIKDYAESIKGAGRTLLALINDVLDFSKIESGKLEILPEKYELASLVSDCYSMVSTAATEKGLMLKANIDPTLPVLLWGDEMRIRQVICNLLTNAVKYTERGFVELAVEKKDTKDEKVLIKVSVKDSGVGIPPAERETIFTAFNRIDEMKYKNMEGTGLGLAISKSLVELMGGTIDVKSEPDFGSIFSFEVWQGAESGDEIGDYNDRLNKLGEGRSVPYKPSFTAPDAKIMVVDDVPINLDVVRGLLKKTQVQLDCVVSAEKAVKIAENIRFDMILMDHMMPGMDGIEALHLIKENGENVNTPIVVMTANAVAGMREQYLKEGFDDYISKPIKPEEMENLVLKYVSRDKLSETKTEKEKVTGKQIPVRKIDSVEELKEKFDFLDIPTGLLYCMNDEEMYTDMLESFVKKGFCDELDNAFKEGDWDEYERKTHALKGLAMTIGAIRLNHLAVDMNNALKNKDRDYALKNHEELVKEYRDVTAQIAKEKNLEV
ncbi:MAG: response regulator [Lachnospiraceae bacterium]|nr:response regulator [Lachnospiraceae bacterium]